MIKSMVLLLLAYCFFPVANQAQERQHSKTGEDVEISVGGAKLTIPDLVLLDQEGRKVRFYSDLIKDKVVVLSFFYTSCDYSCLMQGRTFSKLQSLLGERLGKSVFLISVTTDPVKDNPQQLKAWATRHRVEPGWTLVTGEEAEMSKLLGPFTGDGAGSATHLPSTFIGNDKTGLWTSATGVFAAEDLLRVINYIARDDATKVRNNERNR
ncbi:MAG TPA: SCO family protein [Pyrinomonadaceae bacterium]|nr:SCO family protein [Pyrinomonadaceae bacterium]